MTDDNQQHCYHNDIPLPLVHENPPEITAAPALTAVDIDRIIEMAWEDRTPFDAIKYQFGLKESQVRKLMKEQLRFSSYKAWRMRVEACQTKHCKTRSEEISRFRCSRQKTITQNKISKR